MKPQDYDKLTVQEKRRITPWASRFLFKEYAKMMRKKISLAQRQIENDYVEKTET